MNLHYRLNCVRLVILSGVLAVLVPDIAAAADPNKRLIERGRQLFMNETFNGNGRTCATCHPPTNNFTIDPPFIASLPDDDPLFVAEFNPDLAQLEDPELMRRFGLILENVDGFERPGVFRGVPHTLGLRHSIAVDPAGDDNLTRADGSTVVNATGWSGDGAPGNGSLRQFARGAVIQHFPKTMNRIAGEDFRLPTDAELDALEAFQLSLGRQTELDLEAMNFADPDVQAGKDLFNGVGINRSCAACHNNAGANNDAGFNRNFATNAAKLREIAARRFDPEMPGDGGFDSGPEFDVPGMAVHFHGNESMNTPSLVEAADTGPFFHNNSAKTIEDAVRFYTTAIFSADNAFQLNRNQINQIAAFLRALNALDNIRNAGVLGEDAQRQRTERARQTIEVVMADADDAIEVLTHGPMAPMYPAAVAELEDALAMAEDAHNVERTALRNGSLRQALDLMKGVRDLILGPEAAPEVAEGDGDRAPDDGAEGGGDVAEGDGDPAVANSDQGAAEGNQPAAEGDQAGAEGDQAAVEGDQAAAKGEQAAADGDQAAADGDQPAATGEQAAADDDPAADNEEQVAAAR